VGSGGGDEEEGIVKYGRAVLIKPPQRSEELLGNTSYLK
jgi:hypothetical protein